MTETRTTDDLKELGVARPALEETSRLYRQAFTDVGVLAHAGLRGGYRPSSAEIGSAMLRRDDNEPE